MKALRKFLGLGSTSDEQEATRAVCKIGENLNNTRIRLRQERMRLEADRPARSPQQLPHLKLVAKA